MSLTLPHFLQVICDVFLPVQIRPVQHEVALVHVAPFARHFFPVGPLVGDIVGKTNGAHVVGMTVGALDGISDTGVGLATTIRVGELEGIHDGIADGLEDGLEDGIEVGMEDGMEDGLEDGIEVGMEDGIEVGMEDGIEVGAEDGMEDGMEVGMEEGTVEGRDEGLLDGMTVGRDDSKYDGMLDSISEGAADWALACAMSRAKTVAANFMVRR
jgi:hypothetical protein